ncbi:transporter substrate-binding domain-containing protein [Coraliomargarita sp. W4R72]
MAVFFGAFTLEVQAESSTLPLPGVAPILSGCESDYPPYCIVTPDNRADGFSVELLRAALKAVGREVVYSTGSAWTTLKQDLADGRIQVLPRVARTPEREALFDFTFPYLTMHGTIVVREDCTTILAPSDLKGKQVAVLQGNTAEEYLNRANLGANIVTRTSFETALRELSDGQHDAVVIQKLLALQLMQQVGLTNLVTVGPPLQDFTQSFCFAVRKGDAKLLAALNEGLSIVIADGTFRTLHSKWFPAREALGHSKSRIIIGGDSDYPPYEYLDKNGQPAGFNVAITRAIARQMGLQIEIRLGSWNSIRKELGSGNIDLVQGMLYSVERDQEFSFSTPYAVIQHAIVVRTGTAVPADIQDLAGKSILVIAGDIMEDLAKAHGYGRQLVAVPSQEEALRQLAAGNYDCALVPKVPALYWIEKKGWQNLSISEQQVSSAEYCYAVLKGQEALLSHLSEGLAALKANGEYRRIQSEWLMPYEDAKMPWRTIVKYSLVVILPLVALLLASFLWSRSLRKQVAIRTQTLQQEIAERKRAEDDLRTSQQLIEGIINAIPVRIFWKDKDLVYLGCNTVFAQDAGLADPQEIIGKDDYMIAWQRAQADAFRNVDRQVIESGCAKLLIEESQTTSSGKTVTLLTSKIPLRDAHGEISGMIGVYMDITERKRAEEELQNLRKAVEQSASTIVITDLRGKIEYVNPAFERITGYTKAEALGKNPRMLNSGKQNAEFHRDLWASIQSGKTWSGEFQNKRKDGSLYWESATISPVHNGKGEIVHFIGIKEDITERKEMDTKLIEALNQAEAGNRAKSEFLGIMSHELRTPLNGVLGSAELLTYSSLDPEQKSLVETVSQCGEHLLAIVTDILDFSSMEAGKLVCHVEPIAVAEVVEQSTSAVQKSAADKALAFRCEIRRDVPRQITGDALRIRQILINLLANAIKFTSSGSVVLHVTPSAEGQFLDFSVEDTGIGISSETIEHLFLPFTQADSTMTRAFGGTGLGLTISKRLAEAMSGSITVASIPDKGSTFTFHFPLESALAGADGMTAIPFPISNGDSYTSAQTQPRPPIQTSGPPAVGKLVLVVEDDYENSTLAGKMLQSLGYHAEFAADGAKAVQAFEPEKYFAILMDLVMPRLNGVEATKKIRELEATAGWHVPIIALTANVTPADRELCRAAGMNDFLTKPFKRAELASALASIAV